MRLLLALLLLCGSGIASAGQRAVYDDSEGKKIVIDVGDGGDARVSTDNPDQYGIWQGGHFYMVAREDGAWRVARIEDLAAAFDQVMPPIFRGLFDAANAAKPASKLRIEPKGTRVVKGRSGQVYAVYGMDEGKPKEATEFVLSSDPALRPIGKAMEQFMIATTLIMAPLIGSAAAEMATDIRTIFAYGTPLDAAGRFRLVSIDGAEAVPALFALPAAPQTVAEIVAELKASAAQAQPEAPKAE